MPTPPVNTAGLALPTVTLATVTSVATEQTAQAMAKSLDAVAFANALWVCDAQPPEILTGRVEWVKVAPLTTREAYSQFIMRELGLLLQTPHVLLVQWDGYVLDPAVWSADFLEFDYIGAPWPHFRDAHNVGNGGFSLRSQRLLRATAKLPETGEAEDVAICRTWRPRLEEEYGIRFAPKNVAQRFAFERGTSSKKTFGFHGVFNLVDLVGHQAAFPLLSRLEMNILARNEIRDLLYWALRKRQWRLAWEMYRRLRYRHCTSPQIRSGI